MELKLIYNEFNPEICVECNCDRFVIDNYYICYSCGDSYSGLIIDYNIDPRDIIKRHPYKQKEHFRYKLMKLQGNDNQKIPPEIINTLRSYKYDNIQELQAIMKKLKYREFFKNIILIDYFVRGKLCHDLDNKLYDMIMGEFDSIQESYYEIIDIKRQLFNYNYILFKLLFLFDRIDIAKNVFFIRKYDTTIKKYDDIWHYICSRNNYIYESTHDQLKKLSSL